MPKQEVNVLDVTCLILGGSFYRYRCFRSEDCKIMAKGKKVLTPGDVAKICNVAHRTVQKWFDSGLLTGYRLPGSRDRRIPVSELISFMKASNIPMTSPLINDFLDANRGQSDNVSAK